MYEISDELYLEVAERLLSLFAVGDYYSGSTTFEWNSIVCRLVLSAVIYTEHRLMPEGEQRFIADVVPVWWEFHTCDESGTMLNDFSFNTLRNYLKQ